MASKGYRRTITIDYDYTKVKDGVTEVNRQMRLLDSEYKKANEQIKAQSQGEENLVLQKDKLTQQIGLQKKLIEEYGKKLKEVTEETGENSKRTTNAAIKYNDAVASLNRFEGALESVNRELEKENLEEFNKQADAVDLKMKVLDSTFEKNASSIGRYETETEKLTRQKESLNETIVLQQQKAMALANVLEETTRLTGEESKETAEAAIKYNDAVASLNRFEGALRETNKELTASTNGIFAKQIQSIESFQKKAAEAGIDLQKLGSTMQSVGIALTAGVTVPLVAFGKNAVEAAAKFETAFTGVFKTVDGTERQLDNLRLGFVSLSKEIPISASELANIGAIAGQLGIKTDAILGFTETIARLGQTTNMSAEEAATALAQFANVVGMSQENFDKLGSAITALGNKLSTSESKIVMFGQRLAGAGAQVGMAEAEIMAIAGAFSSLGIEAEAGGTAVSKILKEMQLAVETGSNGLKDFADVAGMTTEEFARAFKENAADALGLFLRGLGTMEESGKSAIITLDKMGLTEARLSDALLRGAGAYQLYSDALNVGRNAWKENNALMDESIRMNETFEAKLAILKNRLEEIMINAGGPIIDLMVNAIDAATPLLDVISKLIEKFNKIPGPIQEIVIVAGLLAAAIGPVTTIFGAVIGRLDTISSGMKIAGQAMDFLKLNITNTASATQLASAGFGKLNAVIAANPVGATIVALTVLLPLLDSLQKKLFPLGEEVNKLVEIQKDYVKQSRETEQAYINTAASMTLEMDAAQSLTNKLLELAGKEEKSAEDKRRILVIVEELNRAVDGLSLAYDAETDSLNKSKNEILDYIKARKSQLELEMDNERINEVLREQIDIEKRLMDIQRERMKVEEESLPVWTSWIGWLKKAIDIDKLDRAEEKLIKRNKELTQSIEGLVDGLSDTEKAFESSSESVGKSGESFEEYNNAMETTGKLQQKLVESTTDMFKKISIESDVSMSDMIENLVDNQKAVEQWSRGIAELSRRGVSEGLLEEMRSMGPASAGYVREMLTSNDSALRILSKNYDDHSASIEKVNANIGKSFDKTANSFKTLGNDSATNYANGMNGGQISKGVQEFQTQLLSGMQKMQGNIKTDMVKLGEDTASGYVQGLNNALSRAASSLSSSMSALMSGANNLKSISSGLPNYAYATGTTYHPGGRAVVGEEGPEIVDLPAGSKVYTAQQSRGMLSQSSSNQASPNVTNNYITMNLKAEDIDTVQKLRDVLDYFNHNNIVYTGVR